MSQRGQARPTIRDVAAAAGVSVTTVSHALNNKGRVDGVTRQRVADVAKRLGYAPSRSARSLRGGRTGTIALLLPSFGPGTGSSDEALGLDNYMRMAMSAVAAAHTSGHAVLLMPAVRSREDLQQASIDGAIVADPDRRDRRLDLFDELDTPYVTIERDTGRPESPWHVSLDADAGMRTAVRHLVDQGAKRPCLLAPAADWAYATNAIDAFRVAASAHDVPGRIVLVPVTRLEGNAYDAVLPLLDGPGAPDAVIALAERFAAGVLRAAGELELTVPDELLVMSGADSYHARESAPPVTALDMQPELAAERAVAMLLGRLHGDEVQAPSIIDYRLHVRRSTLRAATAGAPATTAA